MAGWKLRLPELSWRDLSPQLGAQGARAGVHDCAICTPGAPEMYVDRVFLPYWVRASYACLIEQESLSSAGHDHSAIHVKLDDRIVAFHGEW
jgi:hypothetical protein